MAYAQLIARLTCKTGNETVDRRHATLVSRLKKVISAAGWAPEIDYVDRSQVIDSFAQWSPATLDL